MDSKTTSIAVIGLGYVGLPLAVEFGKHINTIGFDIDDSRIKALANGHDKTLEVDVDELKAAAKLRYTSNSDDLAEANVYIVTVPTPIDRHKNPDLAPLQKASELIGRYLSADDVVIYESTVYPGATEEFCVPILATNSGLEFNSEFFVGYSPERINPGDKEHGVTSIQKVTSGSTPATADFVDDLYKTIITAGTHKASSVKVAEAAKVIENTQRDVNIALINELAMIFKRMDIDTEEVLKAAGTKWNFLPFRPGLVGGHCIGVDPYYLTHKAIEVGYHPEMILAGRRINDDMGCYVVDQVSRIMTQNRIHIVDSKVLVMGLTFKENCPDLRNTRVIDIIDKFTNLHASVDVYDPWVDADEAFEEYGFRPVSEPEPDTYDAIILVVAHRQFMDMGADTIRKFGKTRHVLFDVKYMFPADKTDGRL
jgi:UDP-N-acetyl-D-galactosamine dehydrogenase